MEAVSAETRGLSPRRQERRYDRLDLRATMELGEWKVSAFVRNVLDSFDYTNISYNGFVAASPAEFLVMPLEPRTFGAIVSRKF